MSDEENKVTPEEPEQSNDSTDDKSVEIPDEEIDDTQPESAETDTSLSSLQSAGSSGPTWAMFAVACTLLVILSVSATYLFMSKRNQPAIQTALTLQNETPSAQTQGEGTKQPAATRVLPTPNPTPCHTFSLLPTPDPTVTAAFPAPSKDDWSEGPENALVTFTVYSDFMCPYCIQFESALRELRAVYPEKIRVVFRHFPIESHDKAFLAASAAEAAAKQNKFFDMKNYLFETATQWNGLTIDSFKTWLLDTAAKEIKLDVAKFKTDLESKEIKDILNADVEAATKSNVTHTPYILFNGQPYQGGIDFDSLEAMIKVTELEKRQYSECPAETIDAKAKYTAEIKTTQGSIIMDLFPDVAPITVNSFIFLAEQGWYNDNEFFRVIPDVLAQVGDPTNTGYGIPGYLFRNEISALNYDKEGVVGMASAGPDTNGSQFFITMQAAPTLDGNYTIFGQVTEGMDVVRKLATSDPQTGQAPAKPDKIITITITKHK